MSDNVIEFPPRRLTQDAHAECIRVGAVVGVTDCGDEHIDMVGAHLCRDGLYWVLVDLDGCKVAAFRTLTEALAQAEALALSTAKGSLAP